MSSIRSTTRGRATRVDRGWTSVLIWLRKFGRRRAVTVTVFGLLGLAGSSLIGVVTSGPLPAILDEFSYLLAADTFSSGRLTNVSHPHWEHFETFHELMQPTYASKYPPGQGLVLALGQIATGSPAPGVWLSAGAMAAASAWMLLIWLPPQWAVLASIFCTVQLSWLSYWSHSYWGGAVAATGGALAFGAFRLLTQRPRLVSGVTLGVGLGILAASRPYEGAVAGSCIAIALAVGLVSAGSARRVRQLQAILAATCVVAATLGWLGYYNWRVTSSALTMPHQLYQLQYSANPLLLLGTARRTPTYRHVEMERLFLEWGETRQQRQRLPLVQVKVVPIKLVRILVGLLGLGSVALIGLPGIVRRRSLRFVFVTVSAVIGAALLTAGSYPHYVAPVASLFYVALGAALAFLHRKARRNRSTNVALVAVAVFIAFFPFGVAHIIASPYRTFARNRAVVVKQLESRPEKSLVFVTYGPKHTIHEEWVYNRADIDAAKVVWARTMSAAQDQELIEYFRDRKVWLLAPDDRLTLLPYSPASRREDARH